MGLKIFKNPILGHYYITERCNARCVYCDIPQRAKNRGDQDAALSEVEKDLFDLKKMGVKFIDFTGGEPLLHPQLPQMLKSAKELGLKTTITTNCLLYPKRASEIKGLVDFLHFSIDSLHPSENDRLRGVGSFRSVIKSIELAKSLGEKPDLLFTVTNDNAHAISDLAKFAQREKLILIVNPVFVYGNQSPISQESLKRLEKFYGEPYVYFNRAFHLLIRKNGNERKTPRCRVGEAVVVISPQHELLLPCYHHTLFRLRIRGSVRELWQSKIVQKYRREAGTYSFCQNCTINCYFDPSFLYEIDQYFWLSLVSKARYALDKYVRAKI